LSEAYVLSMQNIQKDYFGNKVLKGITLNARAGEVHALLGENGAGKSTLMNILFGMPVIHSTGGYQGKILIDGKEIQIRSPKDAMEHGIGMVHQEFMLIPGFTVTENIKLNREILKNNIASYIFGKPLKTLDRKAMNADARQAIDTLGVDINERQGVSGMPIGYMQFIEIAREIDKQNVRLLVFDEPTAVLTESEADTLLEAMRRITESGIAILFITHRLDEVMAIANDITILRDGEQVAALEAKNTNVLRIAELMVGREIENMMSENRIASEAPEVLMHVKDLKVQMPGEQVKGVDLEIIKGEILGLGGLAGQGKIGIANGIMGLYPATGSVTYKGVKLPFSQPEAILRQGIAFVSEDRRGVGLLLDSSIEDNIVISTMHIHKRFIRKYGPVTQKDKKMIKSHAVKLIKDLDIRCTGPDQLTRRLSGGNQQKVCIARALTLEPDILFVSEPTRGIDIGAKNLVLDTLIKLNRDHGMTIVMTSSELAELRSICDRIAIVTEGKIEGILAPNASDADFGLMMSGDYGKVIEREEA
jgi:simple sugar transport system ATP-binding protein